VIEDTTRTTHPHNVIPPIIENLARPVRLSAACHLSIEKFQFRLDLLNIKDSHYVCACRESSSHPPD
jgi:hypothetical protein